MYMINRHGREDVIYWRCHRSRNSHCTGSITTGPGDAIVSVKDTHNHPPDQASIEVKKLVSTMKEKVQDCIRPIPQLYQEALVHVTDDMAAQLPTLVGVKSSLYRRRRKLIPQLPQSRADVHFDGEWTQTFKGTQFLLAEDGVGVDKMIIFATEDNLRRLAEAGTIHVDGTFSTCPRLFYQIFTIHAATHGRHIPLVYCLLPNKRQDTYERVFQILEEKVRLSLQHDLSPSSLLSDFEVAIIQAVHAVFPATSTKGCYFQALHRKIQQLGLQVEYQQNNELRNFVRKVAALAFLPLRYVRLGWTGVKATVPALPRIDEFVDYIGSTWISGNFPPALWNISEIGDCRTNHNLEGWHSKLKKVVGKAHPNVFEIVRTFKLEQAAAEVSVAQLQAGAHPPPKPRAILQKNKKIAELKRRFTNNELNLEQYIKALSGHTSLLA